MGEATPARSAAVTGHVINNEVIARADLERHNPAHPAEVVARFASATSDEVSDGVGAAVAAFNKWSAASIIERARVLAGAADALLERQDQLAALITLEQGKTIAEAAGEVGRAVQTLRYHAGHAWEPQHTTFASLSPHEQIRVVRAPLGALALVTPWNFPVAIPVWKLAPALLWGNTAVWKPAGRTPTVDQELIDCFIAAGIPPGVLNLIEGGPDAGAQLVADPRIAGVAFTGSNRVGREIWFAATNRGAKAQLELGGHNAAVVLADADLDLAVSEITRGAMSGAGQKCTSTRRVFVEASVYDDVVAGVVEQVSALRVGDGMESSTDVGPLVTRAAMEGVGQSLEATVDAGANALVGGTELRDSQLKGGHYFAPTVLVDVPESAPIATEEVFGPAVWLAAVSGADEAVARANDTRYGLAAAVFSIDRPQIARIVDRLRAGVIHVNRATVGSSGAQPHVPFGGLADSARGGWAEQGPGARDFYSDVKTVYEPTDGASWL